MKYILLLLFLVSCNTTKVQPTLPPEDHPQEDCCNRGWQVGHDTLYFIGYIKK